MAWTRTSEDKPSPRPRRAGGRGNELPSALLVLLAAVVLLVLGGAAWWALRGGDAGPNAQDSRRDGLIAEATPAPAPKAETPAPAARREKSVEVRRMEDGRYMKYVDGKKAWMYPRKSVDPPARTNGQHRTLSVEQRIFKYRSDMEIAGLLMAHPGDMAIGEPDYEKYFEKDFLKSLEDPAFPLQGDTEEERALKKAVTEAKAELKERYEAGEDLAKVMRAAREELRELGAYRKEIEDEVRRRASDGSLSAEDIEDLVAAANKMLESRGIAPMKNGGFFRHQLRLRESKK